MRRTTDMPTTSSDATHLKEISQMFFIDLCPPTVLYRCRNKLNQLHQRFSTKKAPDLQIIIIIIIIIFTGPPIYNVGAVLFCFLASVTLHGGAT